MRDHEERVVELDVGRARPSHAGEASADEEETTPIPQSIGVLYWMRDCHSVASQLKTYRRRHRDEDRAHREGHGQVGLLLTNMWWPQTMKERPLIATIAPTIAL